MRHPPGDRYEDYRRSVADRDDTYTTLGRHFRTPAHPDVLAALGRAVYCFLSLEEGVTAVLYEAGAADLSTTRAEMAGGKEQALRDLADQVATVLDKAAAAFHVARSTIRNELLHAHPFTAGRDDSGTYLPGLGYTAKDGSHGRRLPGPRRTFSTSRTASRSRSIPWVQPVTQCASCRFPRSRRAAPRLDPTRLRQGSYEGSDDPGGEPSAMPV
jgi:hypothetical protein